MVQVPLVMDVALVVLFGYVTWQAARISKLQYGTKFTSSGPYFVAGMGLLFIATLLRPVLTQDVFGINLQPGFVLGVLQFGAGIFLIRAAYDFYNIIYTTAPFEEDGVIPEVNPGE